MYIEFISKNRRVEKCKRKKLHQFDMFLYVIILSSFMFYISSYNEIDFVLLRSRESTTLTF
jgi:hypothetical protein